MIWNIVKGITLHQQIGGCVKMKDERKRILKMVEEGKLTVDEALTLLEELEKAGVKMHEKEEKLATDLSTSVKFEEAKKEESGQYKFQSTKDKIFEIVDSALKKIKDFDLDLNFGKSIDISHIFQQGEASIRKINIEIANGSVQVIPWDQHDIRVECSAKVYRSETQDDARNYFLQNVEFSINGGHLRFLVPQKWMKVDAIVYVPFGDYEKVELRTFNGAIKGENIQTGDLDVKTGNGKVSLEGVSAHKAEVETGNGQIHINKSKMSVLEAETINGAIKLYGDFGRVDAQSFNGNISCTVSGNRGEYVVAKTVTGSVDVGVPEGLAVEGELKSNIGSFNVQLEGIQIIDQKSEVIQKMLRFKSVNDGLTVMKLFVDTKTGSITVSKL